MGTRRRQEGISSHSLSMTSAGPERKKWAEMGHVERIAWIKEKRAWLAEKRQREQKYLDRRNSDLQIDRAYRADASHELDVLALLEELAEEAGRKDE